MELSKKELICKQCGFSTFSYKDMVEHLAHKQEYGVADCDSKPVITFGRYHSSFSKTKKENK